MWKLYIRSQGKKIYFLINDAKNLRKQNLLCSSKDIIVPYIYILIYEKITNFLTALPNSLIGTAEVDLAPELTMIRRSVLQELQKQKEKLTITLEEEKPNPNKLKSPLKRKSKSTSRSSEKNHKKRKS